MDGESKFGCKGLSILLVETNKTDVSAILNVFNKNNIIDKVSVFSDSSQLVNHLFGSDYSKHSAKIPTLVLFSLSMSDISPSELINKLQTNPYTKSIRVIFLAASKEEYELIKAQTPAQCCCICKPLNFTNLNKALLSLNLKWLMIGEPKYFNENSNA